MRNCAIGIGYEIDIAAALPWGVHDQVDTFAGRDLAKPAPDRTLSNPQLAGKGCLSGIGNVIGVV